MREEGLLMGQEKGGERGKDRGIGIEKMETWGRGTMSDPHTRGQITSVVK